MNSMVIATVGCDFLCGKLDHFASQRVEFDGTKVGTLRFDNPSLFWCIDIQNNLLPLFRETVFLQAAVRFVRDRIFNQA